MNKLRVWVLGGVLAPAVVFGQNLVINGSFEDYVNCPNGLNQMGNAVGWTAYQFTPVYYNTCDTSGTVSVPLSQFCDQVPAHGVAYAGCVTYWEFAPDALREFIGASLSEPLATGEPYFVSFKASSGGFGSIGSMRWAVSGLGMRFSTFSDYSVLNGLPNGAAVRMTDILSDTTDWVTVSGWYVPDSAYTHVSIGNFFSDTLLLRHTLDALAGEPAAYAMVDCVCVGRVPSDCDFGAYVDSKDEEALSIFPNPVESYLLIVAAEGPLCDVTLIDAMGRIVNRFQPQTSWVQLDCTSYSAGPYWLNMRLCDGASVTKSIVVGKSN
ncbi:MAG: T9SS type A sorting domain-containing protein [Flavobacteriales bacterium]|nr:MAG: T9SS type A sorting domain-containing protein [Flavobacteriales bacterium]